MLSLNLSGQSNVPVRYKLRDLDASANNAIQPFALHARIGNTGAFNNIADAFVADATTVSAATQVSAVDVLLPAAYNNQALVQLRIMTSNAVGNDEWVGVDDIEIGGTPVDIAPTVASTAPANLAVNVALNSNITISFSENVNVSGAWFQINCASGARSAAVSGGPRVYTLDPNTDFAANENCSVTIVGALVQDSDGTPDAMAANFNFSFQTAVDNPPSVSSTIPANNQINVALNSNLVVNFSEPVTTQAGAFTLTCSASNAHTLVVSSNASGNQRTLDPSPDFLASETCVLSIIASLVSDLDGVANPLPANVNVNFNTASGAGYYASVDASSATTLRTSLHQLIRGHNCYFYSSSICTSPGEGDSVWRIIEAADEAPGNSTRVLDVYKNETYAKCQDRAGVNNNAMISFNREHSWPNSYGFNDRLTVSVNAGNVPNCPTPMRICCLPAMCSTTPTAVIYPLIFARAAAPSA
ncbi:MAG: Ig-like domain-containing protein [Brachymonas sp.]|nr:Ig-like domain-containing protein [Brachymonas sp.]